MSISPALFSSASVEWETPQTLFDELDHEFHFTLDVCATSENTKCSDYYTQEIDGLNQEWTITPGAIWMNPPYNRSIIKWVAKAAGSASLNQPVVCLLPARVDTRWFHHYIYGKPNVEIRFIRGRLKFGNSKNSAPFPSMIVVFR